METSFDVINPETADLLYSIEADSSDAIEISLQATHNAFLSWRQLSFAERGESFRRLGLAMKRNADVLARQISQEMGKVLPEAKSEIEKCAACCLYYAGAAEQMLAQRSVVTDFKKSYVSFQPLGVIFGILPWNFPYWQFFRFAVPTLMAGNTIVFKHSPNTLGCAETILKLFNDVEFLPHVVSLLKIPVETAAKVIADPRVRGVSLTGSTRAGRSVALAAADTFKPCVLELGGSDAYVVLDDAHLPATADALIQARFLNCGQSCVSGKRFLASKKIATDLQDLIVERMKGLTIGSPFETGVVMGPMARQDLRDQLHVQVERAKAEKMDVVVGGQVPNRKGYFYPATLLRGMQPDTVAFREELFGPVATLTVSADESEALHWANQSSYGLGAAVFSQDVERAEKIAREHFEAGLCFVNDFVRSDIHLPFGGVKQSGLGRELSQEGIRSFVNTKTVCIR